MLVKHSFKKQAAAAAPISISEIQATLDEDLNQFNEDRKFLLNEETDSERLIYESFVESGGANGILKITNFSPRS